LVLFAVLPAGYAGAVDPLLDPSLDYQAARTGEVSYDVDFTVVVTPPAGTERLQVWLPLPPGDSAQQVEERELTTFPMEVKPQIGTEPTFGNRFAFFEFARPQGAQSIRHRFRVTTWELRWNLDRRKVVVPPDWPDSFQPYLRSESQAVVIGDDLRRLAGQLVPADHRSADSLNRVMNWTLDHFTYDHDIASLRASSLHALLANGGHCSDYHGFCAAMGRALGFPTRVTYGIHAFPKNSPSHCKLEAFIPPYGWVSFDVSETQRLVNKINSSRELDADRRQALSAAAVGRLFRGFRDNTWFLQTRGTDYDLVPPASRRVPVVRTIYAEADGVPLADPDPSAKGANQFSWMTLHRYVPSRPVEYPFGDWTSLEQESRPINQSNN
jgi:transglutaminase-like putative cysteine protease